MKNITTADRDNAFRLLNELSDALVEMDVITDDGDRDETDARVWEALNTLREKLQTATMA